MKKKMIKILALAISTCMIFTGCSSGKSDPEGKGTDKKDGLTVIRIGSHAASAMDPDYKDPVTGEYSMQEDRELALAAEQKVKDELGVDIEWVQYPGDTTEVLLQSVIAGDPIADVVNLYTNSQGKILGQNVLQPLDNYLDSFTNEPPAPIYGKHYFIDVSGDKSHPLSPLFYNINYIEQVDALKVNGKTVYPTDLYKEGKWTWSTFEDYLSKIETHFANSQAPERPEKRIDAFRTNYTDTLIQAVHSAGGSVYGNEGLGIESQQTKDAVAFIKRLVDKKLLVSELSPNTSSPMYAAEAEPFEKGESVFVNLEDWRADSASQKLNERGESLGFVPFPRPDSMAFDDPNYRQVRTGGESWGILRGVSEEKIPLAIKTYEMYFSELERLQQEVNSDNEASKVKLKIDIYHDVIGEDMKQIYLDSIEKTEVNEFSNMTNSYWPFMSIAGDSIYGIDGSPSYETAIQSRKHEITDKIAETEKLLNTTEAKDNIAPVIKPVDETKQYQFQVGTDLSTINWSEDYTVSDNMDKEMEKSSIQFDMSAIDVNKAGLYKGGLIATAKDSVGNEGKLKIDVVIFDPNNKVAPTLTVKPEFRKIAVDEDTSAINWGNDFVDVAQDASGIDIKNKVTADLSELDTTTAGTYKVILKVVDFAGNETTKEISVVVE
ncbi:MAG: hypothetical protein KIC92_06205 [Clostridiales bacterium]|nr:hypothetical protein [Clostridiales bacterium]